MSEERLQEIKDSVSFQKEILLAHNMDTLCTDEEEELIEEIERLNNIIFNQNKRNSHQRIANDNLQNKNKELNNIINELERYINEEYIYDELGMKIFDASKLQDKLQELKGEQNDK